ncbi:hypothetical protein Goari_007205 [Gossypium aridum]|uniref:Uncharacterized protein n=1 Tax=Gossypium aridum TaxID=34290 RepID=A0A7J8XQ83_GOSAI|nr:hypothetical protein [Gossypium aridum]
MTQFPSTMRTIPSSLLLPSQWPQPHNEELLLAMEESNLEDKRSVPPHPLERSNMKYLKHGGPLCYLNWSTDRAMLVFLVI